MLEAEEIRKLYLQYANQNIEMPKSYFDKINETEMLKDIVNNAIHSEEIKQKLENIYQNYKDIIGMDSMETRMLTISIPSFLLYNQLSQS